MEWIMVGLGIVIILLIIRTFMSTQRAGCRVTVTHQSVLGRKMQLWCHKYITRRSTKHKLQEWTKNWILAWVKWFRILTSSGHGASSCNLDPGAVWMPQFPPSAVIRNESSRIKVKKLEKFCGKINTAVCKLFSMNAQTLVSPSFLSNTFFLLPAPALRPLWERNGSPSIKMEKLKIFYDKIRLTGCIWFSLKAPSTETLLSHLFLGEYLFLRPRPIGARDSHNTLDLRWGCKKRISSSMQTGLVRLT